MRVFIAGIDGYLGWSLAVYLAARGHDVGGCDNYLRRKIVREVGGDSAIPLASNRFPALEKEYDCNVYYRPGDLTDYGFVAECLNEFTPDAVVNLGQMPSAPYSMISPEHGAFTQFNNVVGNLNLIYAIRDIAPEAHLVKLGTMGEYGTPNMPIAEGFAEMEYRGKKDRVFFPRCPGSIYHVAKVQDSYNVDFACRIWGLRATDIMQGVVFGTRIDEMRGNPDLATRFDYDEAFGTAINRFCAQAVMGQPITPYGKGHQKRGFLPLKDAMQCLRIALDNPPGCGENRTWNQFEQVYRIDELAGMVKEAGERNGLKCEVKHIGNPRKEAEEHYYNPEHEILLNLGYQPSTDMEDEIDRIIADLIPHRDRIIAEAIQIGIKWVK